MATEYRASRWDYDEDDPRHPLNDDEPAPVPPARAQRRPGEPHATPRPVPAPAQDDDEPQPVPTPRRSRGLGYRADGSETSVVNVFSGGAAGEGAGFLLGLVATAAAINYLKGTFRQWLYAKLINATPDGTPIEPGAHR